MLQTKMLLNVSRLNAISLVREYRYYCSVYFFMFRIQILTLFKIVK